jgi:hypothetical protein
MVSPLANILSGNAIRNWLRTDGAGIFRAYETGVEALDFIRSHLGAIRTQDFYEIRRQVLSVQTASDVLSGYPTSQLIPLAWHNTDHGLNLSSEFQYRIELFGFDPNTGQIKNQFMTVAADRQLTSDQVQDVARSYVGEGGESGEIVLSSFGEITPMKRAEE